MPASVLSWVGWPLAPMVRLRTAGILRLGTTEEAPSLRNSKPNSAISLGAVLGHFISWGLGQTSVSLEEQVCGQSLSASAPSTLKGWSFPRKGLR